MITTMPSDPNSPPPRVGRCDQACGRRTWAKRHPPRRVEYLHARVEWRGHAHLPRWPRAAKFLSGRRDPRDAERLCVNHLVTTDQNKSSRARATSKGSQHIAPRPCDMRNGSGNGGADSKHDIRQFSPLFRALQRVDRPVDRYGTGNWNYEEFIQE
jgi:hypothetical protein